MSGLMTVEEENRPSAGPDHSRSQPTCLSRCRCGFLRAPLRTNIQCESPSAGGEPGWLPGSRVGGVKLLSWLFEGGVSRRGSSARLYDCEEKVSVCSPLKRRETHETLNKSRSGSDRTGPLWYDPTKPSVTRQTALQ